MSMDLHQCSRNSKRPSPNHEDLPLEFDEKLGVYPPTFVEAQVGRDLLYQGDPYAFFVPGVVFFLYLGFGTIYSTECLCQNERCESWVSRLEKRGGCPGVPGSLCRTSKAIASLFFFSMAPEN